MPVHYAQSSSALRAFCELGGPASQPPNYLDLARGKELHHPLKPNSLEKTVSIDDYVIETVDDQTVVRYGKFSATLAKLEESGVLTSKSGRTHVVPAWVIAKLAAKAPAQ